MDMEMEKESEMSRVMLWLFGSLVGCLTEDSVSVRVFLCNGWLWFGKDHDVFQVLV